MQPNAIFDHITTKKMNKHLFLKISFLLFLIFLSAYPVAAKSIIADRSKSTPTPPGYQLSTLEEKIRPFLENRLANRKKRTSGKTRPVSIPFDEKDIQILARAWNFLSPEFKQLYTQAVALSVSDKQAFISPGKNFEIYYSINGKDSVSTIDTYMYDYQNWRNKIPQPNGVPDYVDEVAWALDSAWSMEIDNFRFNKPYPYKDLICTSDRYKVIIERPDDPAGDYGFTWPYQRVTSNGFSSYIIIRNEWDSFRNQSFNFTYDINPLPAIQVTCAHEFFHAIQYAMSWDIGNNTELDDFPLSWIEGSAVTMEELAFPDANDYHMYTKSFFDYPQMSFFLENSEPEYKNSLFLIYLCTRTSGNNNAGFIHRMHFRNYSEPAKFVANIEMASQESGLSWPQLLNRFFAASYFTGTRADTTRFIGDAAQFMSWNYPADTLTIQKIAKNASGVFSFKVHPSHTDTLRVFAGYQTRDTITNDSSWAATALLRSNDSTSIIPFSLDKNSKGLLTIPQWKSANELLVVVTSGFSDGSRLYDVDFAPCAVTYTAGTVDTVFLDSISRGFPFVTIEARADLRCELSLTGLSSPALIDSARKHGLEPVGTIYRINYPTSWTGTVGLRFLTNKMTGSTLLFCKWNTELETWNILDTLADSKDVAVSMDIIKPGSYGFFINHTESEIIVFPNPARISNGTGIIHYRGSNISEVLVYAVDGTLVYSARHHRASQTSPANDPEQSWTLNQSNGRSVTPGIYTVLIKYLVKNKTNFYRKKILLIP